MVELNDSELSFAVVGWKGARSLRAYVSVAECVHMLRLLGADISKYGKYENDIVPSKSYLEIIRHIPEVTVMRSNLLLVRKPYS